MEKIKSLANNLCNKKLYIVLDLDVMAKNQGVGSKVILCKSCSELSLFLQCTACTFGPAKDYRCPARKLPLLHGQKSTPTPKFLVTAEAYFVYHIGPIFLWFMPLLGVLSPLLNYNKI